MRSSCAVVIHYAPSGELSDRLPAEQRLTRLIHTALGNDMRVRFTESMSTSALDHNRLIQIATMLSA